MKKHIKLFITHPLISGSSIVFVGSFGANVLGYLFNLLMGRMLPVAEYGLLTTLTSLLVLFGIFQLAFVSIFAKFSAVYNARKDEAGFSNLLSSGFRFVTIFAGLLFIALLFLIPLFADFLKIDNWMLLILIFLSICLSILYAFPAGLLQGEMQFKTISFLNILSPFIKLVLGIALVIAGYQVFGVLMGILIATVLPLVIAIITIRRKHAGKAVKSDLDSTMFIEEFKKYSFYFFLATLGMSIISNADILLVRSFFEPEVSGQYAALSLMGKAIFYLTSPIYFVFFPLIASKKEKNENVLKTLLLTVGIITSISVVLSFIYFMFPQLVLRIFFPAEEYRVLINYLGPFSLFILVFSLANLFNNYFLSIGRTSIYKINIAVSLLFLALISFFHASLYQVIGVLFATSFLLLVSYLLYYYHLSNGKD